MFLPFFFFFTQQQRIPIFRLNDINTFSQAHKFEINSEAKTYPIFSVISTFPYLLSKNADKYIKVAMGVLILQKIHNSISRLVRTLTKNPKHV